ncbi:MAG TPA: endopeptidase La [Leptospiraceae bacterium]|nr:endopeptidase La [Leptospiraceae bacterium]HMW07799.1 endopeptidase La [Leptospiraceae bacterium]HMX35047.1 endopeptidase La [Leptospiraceae bacterium]HMY33424.1 endopeptidase La [Leptospiraceae bacterium]HMZ64057.1 endopeptidase La [Leptospiraceae bacterium]
MKKAVSKKNIRTKKTSDPDTIEEILPDELHIIPIKNRPIFPGIITPLIVPVGKFSNSVDEVYKNNGFIGLSLLIKEESEKNPVNNIYTMGVIAKVLKKMNLPDGGTHILINTIHRFKITKILKEDPYLVAKVDYPVDKVNTGSKIDLKAMMRNLLVLTKELAQNNPLFTEDMKLSLVNMHEPGRMADFVASILNLDKEEFQFILEEEDVFQRLEKVIIYLKKELELIAVQRKINDQINSKMDKQQRQFFLREQLKAIQGELGMGEEKGEKKYDLLLDRLKKAEVSEEIYAEVKREIERIQVTDYNSPEYNVTRNYLEIIDSLPWEAPPKRNIDIQYAKKILDRDHYRLTDVKDRILEFLAVKKLNPDNKSGTILCLVGPPGVGKTSIAKSVAEALGRKFYRFSLGGVRDEAEVKGHRRTYVGALPGKILSALRILKEKDPVILLDEIDKIKTGYSGDPAAALLEVLDPEQNVNFRDHYLDLPFDLSKVLFIATANTLDTIPRVLVDRMDVIRLSGYITEEKIEIFKKYLWKKVLKRNGLGKEKVTLTSPAIQSLINSYSREAGLRNLERMSDKIARKIAYKIVSKTKVNHSITPDQLEEYLGVPLYVDERMTKADKPGMALGLAWTAVGGATLLVEAIFLKGKEGLMLTGKLGKTMNESTNIAYSYVRNLIDPDGKIFSDKRIHIHVPDGATPKDGPSAGITMAAAIYSLAKDKVVRDGFGMTGELTLTGEVLAIGGLKEKIVAAKRVGVTKIIYPKDNDAHLKEIPDYVKKGVTFYPVSHFKEVEKLLF